VDMRASAQAPLKTGPIADDCKRGYLPERKGTSVHGGKASVEIRQRKCATRERLHSLPRPTQCAG
jgi:hypothetical protein